MFEGFRIDSIDEILQLNEQRIRCPECNASEAVYCPFCCIPLGHVAPQVELPIQVDIYRHPNEKPERTTTVHCKLVAPKQVNIIPHKVDESILSRYTDPSRVLLLYPSKTSVPLSEIPLDSFDTLVVIDGTWTHAKGMATRASTLPFRHVRINSHETLFWRFQLIDRTFLSTIEAIYWFFQEYHTAYHGSYDQRYDNLLFYFKFKWTIIQNYYKENRDKRFTPRHAIADSYIHYN